VQALYPVKQISILDKTHTLMNSLVEDFDKLVLEWYMSFEKYDGILL
jgi:hypothetical protein